MLSAVLRLLTPRALSRWAAPAAILGGVLWVPHGVFEMLPPWGTATVYREELGYELITDSPLFVAYSLPGSLALLLTGLGLLGITALPRLPIGRLGRAGLILAYIAVALAVLSFLSVIMLFTPLFIAGLVFGSFFLGAAALTVAIDARRAGVTSRWTAALVILGLMGLCMLPLRLLVNAMAFVPPAAGAAFIGLFGLGWIGLGYALWVGGGSSPATTPATGRPAAPRSSRAP